VEKMRGVGRGGMMVRGITIESLRTMMNFFLFLA